MHNASRLLLVTGTIAVTCGVATAAPCDSNPIQTPCEFQGLNNIPTNAFLFLDEDNHLVVCAAGQCTNSATVCSRDSQCPGGTCVANSLDFGVRWEVPAAPPETGHADWIDLGFEEFEEFADPGNLTANDATLEIKSMAEYTGQGVITIPSQIKDVGTTVDMWVDYTPINAAQVRYEVFANISAEKNDNVLAQVTIAAGDAQTMPVNATDWPTKTWMSRWIFPQPVDIVLPAGGGTVTGRILAAIPLGPGTYQRTGADPSMDNTAKGEIQQTTNEEVLDACETGRQFTMVDEAPFNDPFATPQTSMPALSRGGLVAAGLVFAAWFVWLLGRRPGPLSAR